MKTKITKSKYFAAGLIVGLGILSSGAYAAVTGAGTLGSLFEKVGSVYRLVGDNIKDNTVDSSEIENETLKSEDILDGEVKNIDLGTGSVIGGLDGVVKDESLTSDDLAEDSVGNSELNNTENFTMGNITVGKISANLGQASGYYSTAMGRGTLASQWYTTAMGYYSKANGQISTAMGWGSESNGDYSTAMGYYSKANGQSSIAGGYRSTAVGANSIAMGYYSKASGYMSTAFGSSTEAIGYYSTAMGYNTKASGLMSTAMGYNTKATSIYSTILGVNGTTESDDVFTVAYNGPKFQVKQDGRVYANSKELATKGISGIGCDACPMGYSVYKVYPTGNPMLRKCNSINGGKSYVEGYNNVAICSIRGDDLDYKKINPSISPINVGSRQVIKTFWYSNDI